MLITKAPPAAPLTINSTDLHLFMAANGSGVCFLDIPGSSGLDLQLLNVTATGSVKSGSRQTRTNSRSSGPIWYLSGSTGAATAASRLYN